MEKLFEKKNLGIPATLLAVFAYFIGYYISVNYSGFLVAFIFAIVIFALDFDEKIKTAVKQAYVLGFVFCLINLGLSILYQISNLVTRLHFLSVVFSNLYNYPQYLFNAFVVVVFAILIIMTLLKKDVKINFILNILGEGTPKPQQQPPMYQQQVPPMQQQAPPMQQPMYQQPVPPRPQQAAPNQTQPVQVACPKCGTANHAGAVFCASCGTKL